MDKQELLKAELLKATEQRSLYDYIANNYHNMTRYDLKDVCLEVLYSIHQLLKTEQELFDLFSKILSENLEERLD